MEDKENKDYVSTDEEMYQLLDAGLSTKQLAELAEEQMYYEYDVTDEMELIRALNIKFKINHNDYDFGVEDY